MTDLSLNPPTLPVPHADPVAASLVVSSNTADLDNKPLINGYAAEEEEDYTIKCVCDYEDDDGNTVQCETCETWQHIECYYPGTNGPGEQETHNCVDCEPRPIDGKRATERQRFRRVELDFGDRKPKKPAAPAAKNQKKKVKSESTNGWHDSTSRNGASGSPKDAQSAKRPKASHRSSNSTTQIVPLKLPGQSRRSASASHTLQSPSKTNGTFRPDADQFSEDFVHLYDNDPGETELPSNRVGLQMMKKLIEWSEDPDAVRRDANGKSQKDIFFRCEQLLESMSLPLLHKQERVDTSIECHGLHPKWVYLTVESETPQHAILGELRGKIGHMTDYVHDERNRWDDIRHPLPFVFFHPNLPIYIDTREEGTICRYVRRSCRPNVHLKTILEGSDYHFCLVANAPLQPGEQLTLPWTPDEHVRAITGRLENHKEKEKTHGDGSEEEEEYVRQFFSKVLAEFGGCACDEPATCPVRMWDRRKLQDGRMNNGKSKRGRKSGAKSGQSGRAAGSRSGSEALRYRDEEDDDDSHSTSASSRGKPHSRDLTPSHDLDHLGPDVDDRTKRKIAALEKQEHDKHQPATKKKKRNSGGSSLSHREAPASASRIYFPDSGLNGRAIATSTSVPTTPQVGSKARYVDAGTHRKTSNSPISQSYPPNSHRKGSNPHSPGISSPLSRANYVDCSVQCDMEQDESPAPKTCAKRPFQSLSKRLLRRFHQDRSRVQVKSEDPAVPTLNNAAPMIKDQSSASPHAAPTEQKDADGDVSMGDMQPAKLLDKPSPPQLNQSAPSDPVPISDTAVERHGDLNPSSPQALSVSPVDKKDPTESSAAAQRVPSLHVPMPPRQSFNAPSTNNMTPTSASTATNVWPPTQGAQTPTGATPLLTPGGTSVVQPSPIKKKLSLGDYMSRRSGNMARAESATSTGSTSGNTSSPTATAGQNGARKDSAETITTLGTVVEEPMSAPAKDEPHAASAATSGGKENHPDVTTGALQVDMDKATAITALSPQQDVNMADAPS